MINKLRVTVDMLFEEAPRTKAAADLKEEVISNLIAKYNDLVAAGKTEDEAYNIAVTSIGDLNELLRSITPNNPFNYQEQESERKKGALVVTVSVGLYILAIMSLIYTQSISWYSDEISLLIFFALAGGATCLLVYYFMTRPKYQKYDTTMVEEFKEWKQDAEQNRQIYRSISSIMWTLIVIIYFMMSFNFWNWDNSWIIFIIGAAVQQILKLLFQLKEMR